MRAWGLAPRPFASQLRVMSVLTPSRWIWLVAILLGALVLLLSGEARGQSCTQLSGAPFCGGSRAHAQVGNILIFPQGPPARRIGNFVELREDGRTRLVGGLPPAAGAGPPVNARPAGQLIELGVGRDFGAFRFSTGVAGRLSGR